MNDQLKENVELAKSSDSFLFDKARIRPYRRSMNRFRLGEWHCWRYCRGIAVYKIGTGIYERDRNSLILSMFATPAARPWS